MIRHLDFSDVKAAYLLDYATSASGGGDKRAFWRGVMGFQTPDELRNAGLAEVSEPLLRHRTRTAYGDLYEATVSLTGPAGTTRRVRPGWIVRSGESVARFVTAYPAPPADR